MNGGTYTTWRTLLIEGLKGLLNVVDARPFRARLHIQTNCDLQLRLVEVEDLTQQYAVFHFGDHVLDCQYLIADAQGIDPADQEVFLELANLHIALLLTV